MYVEQYIFYNRIVVNSDVNLKTFKNLLYFYSFLVNFLYKLRPRCSCFLLYSLFIVFYLRKVSVGQLFLLDFLIKFPLRTRSFTQAFFST